MPTNFPTSLDALTNPSAIDNLNTLGVKHSEQHTNINDAVEALEAKVGVNSSAVASSLDYAVNHASGVVASKLPLAGGTMTGFITLHADPDAALKAATKQYVDTSVKGYVLYIANQISFSPADSTTYYWGGDISTGLTVTYNEAKVYVPKTGTVKNWFFKFRIAGTIGSGETVSHYLRLNDATDFGQLDATYAGSSTNNLAVTGLSQAVTAGDYIAVKMVTPAWVTNPTQVRMFGYVYIE
jgi:hypothetical protein